MMRPSELMMKPEPEVGAVCGWRPNGVSPKKRFIISICGSSESPVPIFLRTSMNTTAGSVLLTTLTNGLSGPSPAAEAALAAALTDSAGADAGDAFGARRQPKLALTPSPTITPKASSAAAAA
jgi:hypothetical protein